MGPPLRSDKIIILVTADSDQFYPVEITGSTEPAIREKIFSKVDPDLRDHVLTLTTSFSFTYRTRTNSIFRYTGLRSEDLPWEKL